ncbi:MAG TPA: S41 family peptidase [Tepidisphaeraceae bacterium]|jgi:carboxyl-terminal processing protease|nr:S41 family peptidase [Tepidisphaeraceae bacterium]
MTRTSLSRFVLLFSLAISPFIGTRLFADAPTAANAAAVQPLPEKLAEADQLKSKAFAALKAGKFELTNDYLSQAAQISKDPVTMKMADWTRQFEQQRQVFKTERQKEYEKAVKDVHLLLDKNKLPFAMEVAAGAYLLADDKDGFRKEPWAEKLLGDAKRVAGDYEKNEQWLKALRLYSQLSTIEPNSADWKEHLKTCTRRIRLLALYTPAELKKIQDVDGKEREEVDALLHPTTQPTTKPAQDEEAENANRIDWRETLRDVHIDMLENALFNARANYYRDVNYQKMMLGGLGGLRIVLTTPALEKAFAGLKDTNKRSQLLGFVDGKIAKAEKGDVFRDEGDVRDLLRDLRDMNDKTVDLPEEVLVSEFADGAFAALDPFSNIIWPSDWEEFQKTTKGEFSGVGIQIQTDEAGNLKVVSPLEDSPAYKAGIKPEWIITHIEGKSAKWISLNQAVKQITGPPGTPVKLTIKDTKANVKDYTLIRDTIKVASIKGWIHRPGGGWDYFIDPDNKIGYIRLTNFTKTTSDDLSKAISDMSRSGARGILLDLRYNPGGLLNSATDVVDKFITDGTIVSTRPDRPDSPNQPTVSSAHRNREEVNTPIIVLVNQYSASASEIVSGALKDHKRALIVGERTFGKGSVQMLYPLGQGQQQAVLKLTTSHYYLPNGKCIHREENSKEWGVDPDVQVEMTPDQMRAALGARQEFDILRDAAPAPAKGEALPEKTEKVEEAVAVTKKNKDPLSVDAQLSAALLLMRLELAGAQL